MHYYMTYVTTTRINTLYSYQSQLLELGREHRGWQKGFFYVFFSLRILSFALLLGVVCHGIVLLSVGLFIGFFGGLTVLGLTGLLYGDTGLSSV